MKTTYRLFAVIAGLVTSVVASNAAPPNAETEKAAIKAVIEEEKDAYVALDDARMTATWIQQPSSMKLYVFDGKERRIDGYAAITAGARKELDSERALASANRTRFEFSNYRITVQGDSAWAICQARCESVWEGSPTSSTQSRVYVLQKENDRWKLALMAISGLTVEKKSAPPAALPTVSAPEPLVTPLKEFGDLIVGRWTSEVVWAVDYPGLGKKGEKVIGFDIWRWAADGSAIECDWMLGTTSGRTLMWWDAAERKIRTSDIDSGGNWAQGTITKQGPNWVWTRAGSFADGRPVQYQSETSFPDNGQTRIEAGATVLGGERNEFRDVFRRIRK